MNLDLLKIGHQVEKFVIDNSPVILTSVGAVGAVATAFLTGKATFKAAALLSEGPADLSKTEKAKQVWKVYVPPAIVLSGTVGAIVMSNRISTKRAIALATAYSLGEKRFAEYREKIQEKLGVGKEQAARDELAQDRANARPYNDVMIVDGSDVLCFDQFTGRYFRSNMEAIKKAQNDTNYQILSQGYASLSDFFERIGLPATSFSEEVGWNNDKKLELSFSSILSNEGKPCISFDLDVTPIRDYAKCWAG